MKKIFILFVVYAQICTAFALESNPTLTWVCEKPGLECDGTHDQCELYALNNQKRFNIMKTRRDIMCRSTIHYHSDKLAEIRTNCGTFCTTSVFYDFSNNKRSSAIDDVLGVNAKNKIAINVDLDGVNLVSIFEKPNQKNI